MTKVKVYKQKNTKTEKRHGGCWLGVLRSQEKTQKHAKYIGRVT